jgi:outer membrane protein assembly factor BamB
MPGSTPPLTVRWSVNVGGTASYPIIIGGKIFVIGGGSPSGLYALDEQTGSILWSQATPAGYGGWVGAAYDNGVLFVVPYDVPGLNSGAMFAFSAADGHQIWSTILPGQSFFTSAPTAVNGIVYTGGAESGGTVYAVRESDGTLLWTGSVENGDSSAPAVTADGMYVSYACPQSYKFKPTSGQLIWHYSGVCEGGGGDSVAIYQGLVYVRDTLRNYPTDGITLSTTSGLYQGGFNSHYSPVFWQNTAFYTEQSSLSAVDLTSSQTLWEVGPQGGDSFSCAPIVVNGIVYAGTMNGNLYGYSSATGSTVFSANLGPSISCPEYSNVPLPGLSAGDGLLVVPVGSQVVALQFTASPSQLVPVTPCRVVDTRNSNGTFGGPAIGANSSRMQHSVQRRRVFAECHSGAVNHLGLSDHLADGERPACRFHHELAGRPDQSQCSHRTRGRPSGSQSACMSRNTTNVILDIDGYFYASRLRNLPVLSADALPHRRHP